ncbi:Uncharacterised protein [Klebsiella pneumoniae]|uniref:hypothetical protein n=1 Tax=Klebsiella pneumoniae TaxID=573 RepID=UPI000DE60E5A|nr:hypothetical protein [Klebsiella pneumoniae]EKW2090828.1 hypothetical protein [Klebsiella variicola]SSJ03119.1 Uncharacterised protein [Klebsiella pneumoniae]HEE1311156.1 hypothetical protein [Klebsiella pneumoniae]HEE1373200.1 hypothetical protein [Klebsiella pneumoniae]
MDFLTFFSKLIEALAWPSVIVFVTHRYKSVLSGLLKSVTSLKVGEHFNATFSAQANEVAIASEEELPQELSTVQVSLEKQILDLPPRLAILDAWKLVEDAIIFSLDKNNLMTTITMKEEIIRRTPQKGLLLLRNKGYLNTKQARLMNELRIMRNKVIHANLGIEPTQEDAENYVRSALAFINLLKNE